MNFWNNKNTNRRAVVAGKFYPGDRDSLMSQLSELFEQAVKNLNEKKNLQAIITPHAGYVFSGKVAASAFNQIPENSNYKRIFVIASSHQFRFNGASVYTEGNYQTPLGELEVDTGLAKKLTETSPVFQKNNEAHLYEHSLEVQLPFLQFVLKNNFKLVPIILGTNRPEDCEQIARTLTPWFTPENFFVISTDFSHYPEYENAKKYDRLTADAICKNKSEVLLKTLEQNKLANIENLATSLCGWTSVLTLLYLTENKKYTYNEVDYQNSGDTIIYGDKDSVVGYWGIAVYNENSVFQITEQEKEKILEKARNSITNYLKTGVKGEIDKTNSGGMLNEITGVFVSIYIKDELRGCIGGFAQEKTLNEMVQEMAVSAARDRRFDNIGPDDLENMELEISVLSPLKEIKSEEEIELGRHGIYIRNGLNTGTFLPQVAVKTGWDVNEFLGRCSRDKAGLSWDGWKTAELFTYEAVIFRGV